MELIFSLHEIEKAAHAIIGAGRGFQVWTFTGEMGAGKTTLIKQVCAAKGVEDVVSSPTFSIINEYKTKKGEKIYHLDLYRLKDEEEAVQAGVEDVLQSGHLCLVEWPEIAATLLPEETVNFFIELTANDNRKLSVLA